MGISVSGKFSQADQQAFDQALSELVRDVKGFRWTNAVQSILRQVIKPTFKYAKQSTKRGPTGRLRGSLRVRNLRPRGGIPVAVSMGYSFGRAGGNIPGKVLGSQYGNAKVLFPFDTIRSATEKHTARMVRDFSENWRRYLEAFASRVRKRNARAATR